MSKFDMNKLMKQAQEMQSQMAQMQEEAANEIVEASAGGGMVTVKATGGGEIVSIEIDPKAIDPDDPEMLADLVLAAVNEALRSGRSLMESKLQGMIPGGLGGLGLPGSRRAGRTSGSERAKTPKGVRFAAAGGAPGRGLVQDPHLGRRVEAAPRREIEREIAPRDRQIGDPGHLHVQHRSVHACRLAPCPPEELDEVLDERGIADPHFHVALSLDHACPGLSMTWCRSARNGRRSRFCAGDRVLSGSGRAIPAATKEQP